MAPKLLSSPDAGKLLLGYRLIATVLQTCATYSRAQKCLLPTPPPASQTHHFYQNGDNTEVDEHSKGWIYYGLLWVPQSVPALCHITPVPAASLATRPTVCCGAHRAQCGARSQVCCWWRLLATILPNMFTMRSLPVWMVWKASISYGQKRGLDSQGTHFATDPQLVKVVKVRVS